MYDHVEDGSARAVRCWAQLTTARRLQALPLETAGDDPQDLLVKMSYLLAPHLTFDLFDISTPKLPELKWTVGGAD